MSFSAEFGRFFHTATRQNGQDHAHHYILGLIQAGRKNMERMEEAVPDLDYEGVQNFISQSPWDAQTLVDEVAAQADGLLGGASDSRLIIDETCFTKKGDKSVGVARQYNGRLGKLDNCQVAVFASLSAGRHSTLVGTRLYLPKSWVKEPERCRKAGIPQERQVVRSKTQLALELVADARRQGLRFGMICVDGGYGKDGQFLGALDEMGEDFVAEVHSSQSVYEENPWLNEKEFTKGKRRRGDGQSWRQPERIDQWAARQPAEDWQRLEVREGARGPVEVHYLARRIWVADVQSRQSVLRWALVW
jgi:SRSO17 transposase